MHLRLSSQFGVLFAGLLFLLTGHAQSPAEEHQLPGAVQSSVVNTDTATSSAAKAKTNEADETREDVISQTEQRNLSNPTSEEQVESDSPQVPTVDQSDT